MAVNREYLLDKPKLTQQPSETFAAGRTSDFYFFEDRWRWRDSEGSHILVPYETYRSDPIGYINNSTVSFTHGWVGFDPATDWYDISAFGLCLQSQQGWDVGDRPLLNGRRCTPWATSTQIFVRVGDNGINITRKGGGNEFNLNNTRWQIYVCAMREVKL